MSEILLPDGWKRPAGYANGIKAAGETIFVAGQVGWTEDERIVSGGIAAQSEQALRNIVAVLRAGGAGPEHLTRMTWYVTDVDAYTAARKDIGAAYRNVIGEHYPAMTLVQVVRLLETGAVVEIEATAVVPPGGDAR